MNIGTRIWHLKDLLKCSLENQVEINGRYIPARPYGWTSIPYRIKAAWMVFTCQADAVIWPEGQ